MIDNPGDLICATEIAELLEVQPSAVSNWQNRLSVDFPKPWGTWKCGSLWLRSEIEEWWADRQARCAEVRLRRIKQLESELEKLRA
jgi:predicted DNA-binding transcriptional regulator AlpA